ncbi:MAG: hypothetical protein JSW61_03030 [Candidatus Thorarchaeota archaeon]|nr:MAG: hypothetical protein JSW61_03030 [Candidatus Thorarchaeota archaeon]
MSRKLTLPAFFLLAAAAGYILLGLVTYGAFEGLRHFIDDYSLGMMAVGGTGLLRPTPVLVGIVCLVLFSELWISSTNRWGVTIVFNVIGILWTWAGYSEIFDNVGLYLQTLNPDMTDYYLAARPVLDFLFILVPVVLVLSSTVALYSGVFILRDLAIPKGIAILAIIYLLSTLFNLVMHGMVWFTNILNIIFYMVGIIGLLVFWGLWNLQTWAYWSALFLNLVTLLIALFLSFDALPSGFYSGGPGISAIITFATSLVVVVCLLVPTTRNAFYLSRRQEM